MIVHNPVRSCPQLWRRRGDAPLPAPSNRQGAVLPLSLCLAG